MSLLLYIIYIAHTLKLDFEFLRTDLAVMYVCCTLVGGAARGGGFFGLLFVTFSLLHCCSFSQERELANCLEVVLLRAP